MPFLKKPPSRSLSQSCQNELRSLFAGKYSRAHPKARLHQWNYEPNNSTVLCVGKTSDENNPLSLRLNIYF